MASLQAKIGWKRPRKNKKKKFIVQLRFNTTLNRKFQKNSKKIQKVKKHHYGLFSSQNRLENTAKERK